MFFNISMFSAKFNNCFYFFGLENLIDKLIFLCKLPPEDFYTS